MEDDFKKIRRHKKNEKWKTTSNKNGNDLKKSKKMEDDHNYN